MIEIWIFILGFLAGMLVTAFLTLVCIAKWWKEF
jgi:hypothetical protein